MMRAPAVFIVAVAMIGAACGPSIADRQEAGPSEPARKSTTTLDMYQSSELPLGEPLAVAVDFQGRVVIADGSPGRVVRWEGTTVQEFQEPSTGVGFYPTDVAVHGFFVYVVDESGREILRFGDQGAYRDVLLNFEELSLGRRVSPYSVAVDDAGRIAVSDVENDQILIFDNYLSLETAFGNYGSYKGQLSRPQGVSFSPRGNIVVADTGNHRVQIFSDGGAFRRLVPAPGQPNPMRRPRRAVADPLGRVIVADPGAGAVFVFDPQGALERTIVPTGVDHFEPTDVEITRDGCLVVADEANRTVYVFKGI